VADDGAAREERTRAGRAFGNTGACVAYPYTIEVKDAFELRRRIPRGALGRVRRRVR
jgi:hypothetical protein